MQHRVIFICALSAITLSSHANNNTPELEEVIVSSHLRSLPTEDVDLFGFGKTLLETPRSASTVSSEQLSRFHVSDIDDLVAFAPGTFTQSFFGVAGSLDIRGTQGESYFRGMRRLDNPGNYPTPIYLADRIDIVRGPASPIFGPAKIGGYLNIAPQSARDRQGNYTSEHNRQLSLSTGSWNRQVVTLKALGPLQNNSGYAITAMHEDSGSYYENTDTTQTVFSLAMDHDTNAATHLSWGMVYHDYTGNQVAGWNRLSQDLIDTGRYLSGSPAGLDQNQDGRISHQEYAATADFTPVTEDGIRDYYASRGLGDVYKRQTQTVFSLAMDHDTNTATHLSWGMVYHDYTGNQVAGWNRLSQDPVSYTHLTLPTTSRV